MINLFLGVMGSGKSERLISDYKVTRDVLDRSLFDRGNIRAYSNGEWIKSRNGERVIATNYERVKEFPNRYNYIDEGQFLTNEQIDYIIDHPEKVYYIAALTNDYQGNIFEATKRLVQHAVSIEIIDKECEVCGNKLATHHLLTGDKETLEKGEYKSVCYECWKKGRVK